MYVLGMEPLLTNDEAAAFYLCGYREKKEGAAARLSANIAILLEW